MEIELTYRNWRGEVAERKIRPLGISFRATEWHPERQWLLTAIDVGKDAERDFAIRDCIFRDGFAAAELTRLRAALARAEEREAAVTIGMTPALLDVAAERRRQIQEEGWTPEHDDEHSHGEMAGAAATYAAYRSHVAPEAIMGADLMGLLWPWSPEWLKPSTARRDLVKAGALILAEIERLDRAALALRPQPEGEAL